MPGGASELEQQGLIDAQRISWIGPLITGDAMAEEDARRQRHHLANEGCCRGAALAAAKPIPVQPGVEASLGVAALIASQWARGRASEPAGAGDSDRAGFAVVRWEGQGGTVGLGSSHGRGDAGPALQPRRQARASPAPMAERSGAQRPARLAGETLAEARSMEGPAVPTSKRSRSFAAHQLWCDRWPQLCHWLPGPVTFCAGEVGRPDQAVGQHFQPPPCSVFTATATACWQLSLPTGPTSNCRSRSCSSRWCGQSAAGLGRCLNGSGRNRGRASAPTRELQMQGRDGLLLGPLHGNGADLQLGRGSPE